jgi:hypothetical protein
MGPLVYAIQQVFPNYAARWLGDSMGWRLGLATLAQSCTHVVIGMSLLLYSPQQQLIAVDANPAADETLKPFKETEAPAQGDPASWPLLVLQG